MNNPKRDELLEAINQLIAIVVGRQTARVTDVHKDSPSERIYQCMQLALNEHQDAQDSVKEGSADGRQRCKQATRKLDTLQSLDVLAEAIFPTSPP